MKSNQLKNQTLEPDNPRAVTTTYIYEPTFGNLKETTVQSDGKTRTEKVTFSPDGKFPISKTNAINHTGTIEFDYRWGKPKRKIDANGIAHNTVFDEFGAVLREEIERPNAPAAKESAIAYWCESEYKAKCDEKGVPNAVYFVAAFDDQGDSPQTVYYDGYGRELLKWTLGAKVDDDSNLIQDIYIHTHYDSQGRKIKESRPGFDLNQLDYNEVRYDIFGQIEQRIAADGAVSTYEYDGLIHTITNTNNQKKRITNNLQGKPIEVIDGLGSSSASRVNYTYDAKGKLLTTKSQGRNDSVIELRYDPKFGLKTYMDDPDMGVWHYKYDSFGQLIREIDAKGQSTEMIYDKLGRMIQRIETDINSTKQTTTWTYDQAPLGDNGKLALGLLSKVNAPHAQYTRLHQYDGLARPIKETTTIRGKTYVSERDYFRGTDRVVWEKYPSGLTVTKEYDSTGYPKALKSVDLPQYQSYLQHLYVYQDIVQHAEQLKAEQEVHIDFQPKRIQYTNAESVG